MRNPYENQTEDMFSRIRSRIRSQVSSNLDYLSLRNVAIRSLDNYENMINIQLVYRIDNIDLEDMLNLNLNLKWNEVFSKIILSIVLSFSGSQSK